MVAPLAVMAEVETPLMTGAALSGVGLDVGVGVGVGPAAVTVKVTVMVLFGRPLAEKTIGQV
jgi:hypothetical protein